MRWHRSFHACAQARVRKIAADAAHRPRGEQEGKNRLLLDSVRRPRHGNQRCSSGIDRSGAKTEKHGTIRSNARIWIERNRKGRV